MLRARGCVMTQAIIVGCGYLGERVGAAERARGAQVLCLVRRVERVQALTAAALPAQAVDLDRPDTLVDLPGAGALIYYFAPPPGRGREDPRIGAFLAALPAERPPRRMVLVSTTGVYGDCRGEWVDENRPPAPQAERAHRRLNAEQRLRAWCDGRGVESAILRVPGIYGPGRLPRARLEAGTPVLAEHLAPWSNRVHVDDLVTACLMAGHQPDAGGIYNVSDGRPTTMTDYFNRVADALGLARPPQLDADAARAQLSAGMLSYLAESKRIDNRRMREELGVALQYPDLAAGLAQSVADEARQR